LENTQYITADPRRPEYRLHYHLTRWADGRADQGNVSFRLAAEVCYFWDLQPEMESITGLFCPTPAEGMNPGQNGTIQIDIF
jgi:hypothetical protein